MMHKITFPYPPDRYAFFDVREMLSDEPGVIAVTNTHVWCRHDHRPIVMELLGRRRIEYVDGVQKKRSRSIRPIDVPRQELLSWNNGRCYLCDDAPSESLHHRIPRKDGGSNHYRNLAPLCDHCHKFLHAHRHAWNGHYGFRAFKDDFADLLDHKERLYIWGGTQYMCQRWQWRRHLVEQSRPEGKLPDSEMTWSPTEVPIVRKIIFTERLNIATLSKMVNLLWNHVDLEAASSEYIEYADDERDIVIEGLDDMGIEYREGEPENAAE